MKGKDHVFTDITKEVVKKELEHPDPNLPKIVCSVAIDYYTGKAALGAINSVLGMVNQSRGALTIATWLNVSTKLSPKYGEPAAMAVAKATQFLTNPKTGEVIVTVAGKLIKLDPGDLVCDVLLGGTYIPSNVRNVVYKPELVMSVSQSPQEWSDVAVRYSALLDGLARVKMTAPQLDTYRKIQNDVTARSKYLADIISQQEAFAGLNEKQTESFKSDQASVEASAQSRQRTIQSYDNSLKQWTDVQKQQHDNQQRNYGGGPPAGGTSAGGVPGPIPGGTTPYCGTSTDGKGMTLCYSP